MMENGWTATKEALPPADEKVLIISKWGHVSDGSLVAYDPKEPPLAGGRMAHAQRAKTTGGARGLDEGLVRSHL
jgi:hypothetical protein